jgi:polar amino acid transport system substrate-binding protein
MKKRICCARDRRRRLPLSLGLSAHADTLDDIKKAGKIRIAIDTAIPPFGMTDDKMQPTGSDVDLARLLAKDLGVELEIVTTTGPTRIPMLQTNKADLVVSTLSITPDRAKVIDFSSPMPTIPRSWRAQDRADQEPADLDGKKVAVVRGTDPGQRSHQAGQGRADRALRGRRHHGGGRGFGAGRHPGDGALRSCRDQQEESGARRSSPRSPCRPTGWRSACARTSPKLLAWINDWVKTNLKNGKLAAIYKQYHGVDIPTDELLAKSGS